MKKVIDTETLYRQLSALVAKTPSLNKVTYTDDESQRWLARGRALLLAAGYIDEAESIEYCTDTLLGTVNHQNGVSQAKAAIYRVWAQVELDAPASLQGSFVPVGSAFDAFATLGKILSKAVSKVLLVDPYMDDKLLTDFVPLIPEGVMIHLLSDEASYKSTLTPAVSRWAIQYGRTRPLEARLANARTLHDRSIIMDQKSAWVLTQSFKDLASRSPASLSLLDADSAALKITAYEDIWDQSRPL